MRLSSLSVGAVGRSRRSEYHGLLANVGVGLFGPMQEVVANFGVPSQEFPPMLAGASRRTPETRVCYPKRGIQLESVDQLTSRDCAITRMAIFEPQPH